MQRLLPSNTRCNTKHLSYGSYGIVSHIVTGSGKPGMLRRMHNNFNNHFCCFGHNIAKLDLLLYYVYRRRYGLTSLQASTTSSCESTESVVRGR